MDFWETTLLMKYQSSVNINIETMNLSRSSDDAQLAKGENRFGTMPQRVGYYRQLSTTAGMSERRSGSSVSVKDTDAH